MAYGAKLPPGGGGGRYGRIVSGSYDETIIIWRRDKEGVWKAQHTLRQADAARSALVDFEARRPPPTSPMPGIPAIPNHTPGTPAYFHALIDIIVTLGPNALRRAINQHPQIIQYSRLQSAILAEPVEATRQQLRAIVTHAIQRHRSASMHSQMPHPQNGHNGHLASQLTTVISTGGVMNNSQNLETATPLAQIQTIPQGPPQSHSESHTSPPQTQTTLQQLAHVQAQQTQTADNGHAVIQSAAQQTAPPTITPIPQPPASANSAASSSSFSFSMPQNAQATIQATVQSHAAAQIQAQVQAQIQAQAQQASAAAPANQGSMARVFKLQFDARRIICCSQTPVIVGWDFANGDAKIEEASRFFGVVE